MPTENRHSEGAAGKAACHRQNCSDGMPSHQGVGDRATEKARLWSCIFAQCADMHPCNTNKYCFGHLPPPCTTYPTPQLRAHLRLLVVMIFAKGERNCTGRTVSEHLANRKAGKAHNKHVQMLTFSVARSPRRVIPRQDPFLPSSFTSIHRRTHANNRHQANFKNQPIPQQNSGEFFL